MDQSGEVKGRETSGGQFQDLRKDAVEMNDIRLAGDSERLKVRFREGGKRVMMSSLGSGLNKPTT